MKTSVLAFALAVAVIALTVSSAPVAATPGPTIVAVSTVPASLTASPTVPSIVAVILPVGLIGVLMYLAFFPNALLRVAALLTSQHGFMFQRINRNDPEKAFITVMNSWSTAALSNGQAVQWDYTTDADGVGVTRPTARATNGGLTGAGIAAEAIASGAYGLCQVYGYHSAVRVRTVTGGSPAIVPGRPLVMPVAGGVWCLESISTASKTIVSWPIGFSFGSTAGFTTITKPAFIKAL